MSDLVYPTLPGLAFPVGRSPDWEGSTSIKRTASGREFALRKMTYPRWRYKLKYEFLRSAAAWQELQQLLGFFNRMGGDFDTFLFLDPDDSSVSAEQFGIGDGSSLAFQLTRSVGGFVEPVVDAKDDPIVYVDGVRQFSYDRTQYLRSTENMQTTAERGSTSLWSQVADAEVAVTRPTVLDWLGNNVVVNKLQASTTTNGTNRAATQSLTGFPASQPVTASIYVKTAEVTCLAILITMKTGLLASVFFDLAAGTWAAENTTGGTGTGNIEVLANGWSRISASWDDIGGGATTPTVQFYMRRAIGLNLIPAIGDGIYLANPQVEADTLATTHIVNTNTSTSAVEPSDYSESNGVVTFVAAPGSGTVLTWDGEFYKRCRFTTPQMDASKFMRDLWEAGKVEFVTVKP